MGNAARESTHLTALDAAFLEIEEGDDSAHMHIGWALVFDPLPGGGTPTLEQIREQTGGRLDALPRFRRRLSSPRVGRLSLPHWVPEPDFDVANQIRRARLPAPGGEAELMEWLGDFFSHRLDRAHPLWQMTLVEGLAGGRWALATKAHHCLVDGVGSVAAAAVMLDAEAEPPPGTKALAEYAAEAEAPAGDAGGRGALGALRGAVSAGVDTALHPRKVVSTLARSRAMVEMLVRDELIPAPRTSLNEPIGASRRLAAVDVPLADLKLIKGELGVTVNDVVLAATVAGLHRLFAAREEAVERVRAMVPVNLREASERMALGNRLSSLFVELPVAEPDARLRLRKVAAAVEALKRGGARIGADAVIELAGAAPPAIQSVIARLAFTPRLFNLTITNVPGPPSTLYALGAPMRRVIPLVPIFSGHAVGVAVVSYDGNVTFGLNADRDTVPDLELMREGIEDSLAEMLALAS